MTRRPFVTIMMRKGRPCGEAVLAISLFSLVFVLLLSTSAKAEQERGEFVSPHTFNTEEPVYFAGDRFTYSTDSGIITGSGNVRIFQSDNKLKGDSVTINLPEKKAEIAGNVAVSRLNEVLEGDRATYDFEKGEGTFYDARGRSKPWYVSADKVEREADGNYTVKNATITTCNLPSPHYLIRVGSLSVAPEDRLVARRNTLQVGRVPIFYLPYYSQGLGPAAAPLEFHAGTQSNLGAYAVLGYNLEIIDGVSMKPYVSGFSKSGVGGGLDGRLSLFDSAGQGRFDSFYISDLNTDNTDEPYVKKDRGKADIYYRQEMPYDLTALIQAEYVTDREFLKTFDFDEYSDREFPRSFVNLERTSDHNVVSLTFRERLVDYITDVERKPELKLELLEQRIRDTGLFLSAANEAAYLNTEPGGAESARNYTFGRLSYPVRLGEWVGLVPFVEGDATYYSKALNEEDEYRLSWETGLVAQSHFHRIYGSPFRRFTAFRHLIIPTVTYRYRPVPDEEPFELPQFDSIDLIDRRNMVEVELQNYVDAKLKDGGKVNLVLYNVTAGLEFDDSEDKFATLENELMIRPVPNWEFALKEVNDFRDMTRSDLLSAAVGYSNPGKFKVTTGVIHEDTLLKPYETQIMYTLGRSFGPRWRAGIEQRYDLADDTLSYQEFWLWRDLHCWEILVRVRDRREATTVMVELNIKAFPLRRIEKRTALEPIGGNNPWPTRW